MFHGASDRCSTCGSEVRTLFTTVLGAPVKAIASYRVITLGTETSVWTGASTTEFVSRKLRRVRREHENSSVLVAIGMFVLIAAFFAFRVMARH